MTTTITVLNSKIDEVCDKIRSYYRKLLQPSQYEVVVRTTLSVIKDALSEPEKYNLKGKTTLDILTNIVVCVDRRLDTPSLLDRVKRSVEQGSVTGYYLVLDGFFKGEIVSTDDEEQRVAVNRIPVYTLVKRTSDLSMKIIAIETENDPEDRTAKMLLFNFSSSGVLSLILVCYY